MVMPALEAARLLAQDGVRATVVNARFCKPLEKKCILTLAARSGLIVTIEEHALAGGFGSAVLECLEEAGLFNVRVKRLGVPDRVIEHASPRPAAGRMRAYAPGNPGSRTSTFGPAAIVRGRHRQVVTWQEKVCVWTLC